MKKTYAIFSLIIISVLVVMFYPTQQRVLESKMKEYEERVNTLSGKIEKVRIERIESEKQWKQNDQTMSGQINDMKKDLYKIQKCIDVKTLDCDGVETKKLISFLSSAYAEGTVTPASSGVPDGYKSTHEIVLSGEHDYREIYKNRNGAGWKNNNPSGLTWGISDELKNLWNENGVKYWKGTPRPAIEKGNYVMFATVEDGVKAKIIAIKERWKNATVSKYLGGWGTDDVKLSFDKSKKISELSDSEFAELFVQQIKKETPGYISQLVQDGIIVIH